MQTVVVCIAGRNEKDRHIALLAPFFQKRKAVTIGKHHIQEHRIRRESVELLFSLGAVSGRAHFSEARRSHDIIQEQPEGRFIINNKYFKIIDRHFDHLLSILARKDPLAKGLAAELRKM